MVRFQRHPRSTELITDPREIRKKYFRSWFVVDLLAVFPFDYMVVLILTMYDEPTTTARNEVRTTRLLRLAKLSRFARMSKLLKLKNLKELGDVMVVFLKNLGVSKLGVEFFMRVLGLCFIMIACMHLLGCVWLHLGLSSIERIAEADENLLNESAAVGAVVAPELLNRNWMLKSYGSLNGATVQGYWGRYVDATYWTVVTLSSVGYGDILPTSRTERVFGIIVIIFGTFLYAYIVGSFTNMLSNMGQDKSNFDSKMRSTMELMKVSPPAAHPDLRSLMRDSE